MYSTNMDTLDLGTGVSIYLQISLTLDIGAMIYFALQCLLVCVWLFCEWKTSSLNNSTACSDGSCQTAFSRSNTKSEVETKEHITATEDGKQEKNDHTHGKHQRANSFCDIQQSLKKQKNTDTCIYARNRKYDDDSDCPVETTTSYDIHTPEENKSNIILEDRTQIGNDRTSDEETDVSCSSADSGISIHNIKEENESAIVSKDDPQFGSIKPSDEDRDTSLDSTESGIYHLNTTEGDGDSNEYERRDQNSSSGHNRNRSQDQAICRPDIETIPSKAERTVKLEYEFGDTLMSCTTECDQNCKDDLREEKEFEETILKTPYKVEPPRQSSSVYIIHRKSEDFLQHISTEDDYQGLMLTSLEKIYQPDNASDGVHNDKPMDTNRITIPSENSGTDIYSLPSSGHVEPHCMLETADKTCRKRKDVSDGQFNIDYKGYSEEVFSGECSFLVNRSLATFDFFVSQTLPSRYGLNSRQRSHAKTTKTRRRHSRIHGTLKQSTRMTVSRLAMDRFFRNCDSRSGMTRILPYRKHALRYNTSNISPIESGTTRYMEPIAFPFLNRNDVPRTNNCTPGDEDDQLPRARSPDQDVTEHPKGAFYAISIGSVTESMLYEWGRLKSFWSFPMDCPVLPITLAKHGFYYTGNSDEVVCFSCHVSHSNWQRGDSVYAVHYQISRRCRFMRGEDVGNVPIHGPLSSPNRRAGGSRDSLVRNAEETEIVSMLETPKTVTSLFLGVHVSNTPVEMRNGLESGGGSNFSLAGCQTASSSIGTSQAAAVSPHGATAVSTPSQTPSASQAKTVSTPSQTRSASQAKTVSTPSRTPSASQQVQRPVDPQTRAFRAVQTSTVSHTATTNTVTPTANQARTGPTCNQALNGHAGNQVRTGHNGNQVLTFINGNQQQSMNQQHPTTLAQRQQQRRLEQNQQPEQRGSEQRPPGPAIANGAATNLNNLGVTTARPRYPNYSVLTVRSSTYNGFPNHLDQTPIQMARAGFFYAGYGDYVRCFFCGGGLRNWEPGDDPWVEHARWFPRCAYVKQNRGQTFINLVLQRHRELTLPNEYINTTTEAASTDPNATSQVQTARVQANIDHQPSNIQTNTQTGTNTNTQVTANTHNSAASAVPAGQVATQRASSVDDKNSPAVLSVKDMGYGDQIIQAAIERLRNSQGPVELTAAALLEIIFSLGDEDIPPGTPDRTQSGSNNAQGPQTQPPETPDRTQSSSSNAQEPQSEAGRSLARRSETTAAEKIAEPQAEKASQHLIPRNRLRGDKSAHSYTEEELKSIQEENSQLKEQMKCKICMDNVVCIAFLPCGHLCCCAECAPAMVKCPICRQIIRGSVKTYLS